MYLFELIRTLCQSLEIQCLKYLLFYLFITCLTNWAEYHQPKSPLVAE